MKPVRLVSTLFGRRARLPCGPVTLDFRQEFAHAACSSETAASRVPAASRPARHPALFPSGWKCSRTGWCRRSLDSQIDGILEGPRYNPGGTFPATFDSPIAAATVGETLLGRGRFSDLKVEDADLSFQRRHGDPGQLDGNGFARGEKRLPPRWAPGHRTRRGPNEGRTRTRTP